MNDAITGACVTLRPAQLQTNKQGQNFWAADWAASASSLACWDALVVACMFTCAHTQVNSLAYTAVGTGKYCLAASQMLVNKHILNAWSALACLWV